MVKIRLARSGAKKRPFYHIVVADQRSRRDGRSIERVGYYNPIAAGQEVPLKISLDRVDYWQEHGAIMTDTVRDLVKRARKEQAQATPAA